MAFECAYPHEEVRVHYSYYIHIVCNPDVKGASLGPLHHPLNHHHHHHRHRHHQPRDLLQSLQPQQQQPMMPIENELCLADINLSLWCNCASHFDVSVSGWWIAQTNIEESSFQSNRDRGTAGRYKYLHSVLDKGLERLESTPPFPFHVQAVRQSVSQSHQITSEWLDKYQRVVFLLLLILILRTGHDDVLLRSAVLIHCLVLVPL